MKVFVLPPQEDWIVDRMVQEFKHDNADIVTNDPYQADIIWLLADWCWRQVPRDLLHGRKVVTTVHHIVPSKFGPAEKYDFELRDEFTNAYHVFNPLTHNFILPLTKKPIVTVPYWANQRLWRPTGTKEDLRRKHGLRTDDYLVGSFQRDTEGHDLKSPKLEKGPDLLCDYIEDLANNRSNVHIVLAGWRRQYVMGRLDVAKIPFTYFERPPIEKVNELYQTLDLYPVAARFEGGPQSLIECGLLNVPCVSRNVGIATMVLPPESVQDYLPGACPSIPNVEAWKVPGGFAGYRQMFEAL